MLMAGMIIALIVPGLFFVSSASRLNDPASLAKTFSPGFLVRSACGKSITFSARVPFHLGRCLFLSFVVRFETKGK